MRRRLVKRPHEEHEQSTYSYRNQTLRPNGQDAISLSVLATHNVLAQKAFINLWISSRREKHQGADTAKDNRE